MSDDKRVNISDEAVEAVLKVLSEHVDASECCVRAALDAAAPHLMAEAWDEGHMDAVMKYVPTPSSGVMNNPYRSAGAGE